MRRPLLRVAPWLCKRNTLEHCTRLAYADVVIIRPAHFGDEARLARVYIDTWRAAYRGLLSQSLLDDLSYRDVTVQWVRTLEHAQTHCFLAQNEREEVTGFITAGPEMTGTTGFDAEVYTLYVLPGFQRLGVGNRLLRAAVDALVDSNRSSLIIWVLKGNPAEAFYRKMGGVPVSEKSTWLGGASYTEQSFGWRDIGSAGRDPFPATKSANYH